MVTVVHPSTINSCMLISDECFTIFDSYAIFTNALAKNTSALTKTEVEQARAKFADELNSIGPKLRQLGHLTE
jgi:hypothetical protein